MKKKKKKLKHNTGKETKELFFFLDDIDECKNNVSKTNKALFSNVKENQLGIWEKKSIVV
jgi:hypothetical protein